MAGHHLSASDDAAQYRLVQYDLHRCRPYASGDEKLAVLSHLHPAFVIRWRFVRAPITHQCAGVVSLLQDAGNQLHVIRGDCRRCSFQAHIQVEVGRYQISELMPPTLHIRLLRESAERFGQFLWHTVEFACSCHIVHFHAPVEAAFQPMQAGRPDVEQFGRLGLRETSAGAPVQQVAAELAARQCRSVVRQRSSPVRTGPSTRFRAERDDWRGRCAGTFVILPV